MIKLIFILVVRFATPNPDGAYLEYHTDCVGKTNGEYDLSTEIMCVPEGAEFRDLIYRDGFES